MRAALERHADGWARTVAAGRSAAVGSGEPLSQAVAAAFERHGGPVLLAAGDTPRLGQAHAEMALGDLAAGADASFGPAMNGGWYLVALARPHARLLALLDADVGGDDVMGHVVAAASADDLDIGLLRIERALRGDRDLLAARLDPLIVGPVRAALSAAL